MSSPQKIEVDHVILDDENNTPLVRVIVGRRTVEVTPMKARIIAAELNEHAAHADLGAAMVEQIKSRGLKSVEAAQIVMNIHERRKRRRAGMN